MYFRKTGRDYMTREQLYKKFKVIKGNHYCKFCDTEADFVIVNNAVYGIEKELPLCKKCAEMLKGKIDVGMTM